jgi:thioredoxin reductase (NADPH)
VSACATCDGFFFRDQDIVVVGGGDSAMEEATFLTRFARSVTIVHRREEFRASRIMLERARNDPEDALGAPQRGRARQRRGLGQLRDAARHRDRRGARPAGLGHVRGHRARPAQRPRGGQVDTDDDGYVLVDAPGTRTNIPGVFACGDLVDRNYRQAITAAVSGCAAAMDAERWLAEGPIEPEMAGGGYGQVSDQVASVVG